jgi:hypothetical protein
MEDHNGHCLRHAALFSGGWPDQRSGAIEGLPSAVRPFHDIFGSLQLRKGCAMNSLRDRRDPRTGRVFGFQSETQRENFMAARARFCNGPNREMPRCTAVNRQGQPCRAARMKGQLSCFRHTRNPEVKRARLAAAVLSGDPRRIELAEMRSARNRLRALWRRDPREPGRTIVLVPDDEAACRAWAARQGFPLDVLDPDFPAFSDACRWIWARMSRGLIGDHDLAAKLARLRNRITEASRAFNHSG